MNQGELSNWTVLTYDPERDTQQIAAWYRIHTGPNGRLPHKPGHVVRERAGQAICADCHAILYVKRALAA